MMLSGSSARLIWRMTVKSLAVFSLEKFDLAAAHPMLAGAGAVHGDGAVDEPLIEALDPFDFSFVRRIAEQHHMEIAVAHMPDDGAVEIVRPQDRPASPSRIRQAARSARRHRLQRHPACPAQSPAWPRRHHAGPATVSAGLLPSPPIQRRPPPWEVGNFPEHFNLLAGVGRRAVEFQEQRRGDFQRRASNRH